jgi:hypothetical protein
MRTSAIESMHFASDNLPDDNLPTISRVLDAAF